MIRRLAAFVIGASLLMVLVTPMLVASTTASAQTTGPTTTQKDLTTCINSNPKPDCGVPPTLSGDRGGSAQYATFAVMVAGLSIIGFVVVRSTRRAARARDAQLHAPPTGPEN